MLVCISAVAVVVITSCAGRRQPAPTARPGDADIERRTDGPEFFPPYAYWQVTCHDSSEIEDWDAWTGSFFPLLQHDHTKADLFTPRDAKWYDFPPQLVGHINVVGYRDGCFVLNTGELSPSIFYEARPRDDEPEHHTVILHRRFVSGEGEIHEFTDSGTAIVAYPDGKMLRASPVLCRYFSREDPDELVIVFGTEASDWPEEAWNGDLRPLPEVRVRQIEVEEDKAYLVSGDGSRALLGERRYYDAKYYR